ncbi:MAG: biotin/lipoate A/B protein ligase family protein [Chloroflexota bacterium]
MTQLPPAIWRVIHTLPAAGAWNMAVDEAILEFSARRETPPTLRLYAWQPACLSLGYAQPAADVEQAALQANGWDLVRRPTGGRAILHTDELTYSVAGPQDEPRLAGGVLESYRVLSAALLDALHRLAVPAGASEKSGAPAGAAPANPVCFEVPSNYEITVDGRKLVGSAQSRRKEGVLQHGSLPLVGDLARIAQALAFPDPAARQEASERLLERATTVERVLGRPVDWAQAAAAFEAGFRSALNLDLQPGELTAGELARARELLDEKFANPSWTGRI